MFGVFDNGKPASEEGYPPLRGCGWTTHLFKTFEEALEYANNWLGLGGGVPLKPNEPWDYSGYGDTIEICDLSVAGPKPKAKG